MKEQIVLVDFENVQKLDLARLPPIARVRIFLRAQKTKLPTDFLLEKQARTLYRTDQDRRHRAQCIRLLKASAL